MLRKIVIAFLFGLSFIVTSAYAGKEDWTGVFTINDGSRSPKEVRHTPTAVSYAFFNCKDIQLGKGCKINGVVIKEDVNLRVDSDVETFTAEVAKLGAILDQSIKLGPTYSTK